jgi:multisubunit Na+/H+ antiporter MnhC subunit
MITAIIVSVIVVAFIVGTIINVARSSKTGMPSQDVLDRATQRAKELDAKEKAEDRGDWS